MFTESRKWIFNPNDDNRAILPLRDTEYGDAKPTKRWIEVQCVGNAQCPHFLFTFYETRVRNWSEGEYWMSDEKNVKLLDIAIYPTLYSDQYIFLLALSNGEMNGNTAGSAIDNCFRHFFKENFDTVKKCFSGRIKSNENPCPIMFPEWWKHYMEH